MVGRIHNLFGLLCTVVCLQVLSTKAFAQLHAPVDFSIERGWYENPFQLVLSAPDPGVTIRYTIDGTKPSSSNGIVYTTPITINATIYVRAIAFSAAGASDTVTHTYLFPADVIASSVMDTLITQDPTYGPQMKDALFALPVVSMISSHPPQVNTPSEQETTLEFMLPDGGDHFQVRSGLETWGGSPTNPKKSYRLEFKASYGTSKLEFPLFDDGHDWTVPPAREFDRLILRAGSQDGLNGEFGNEFESSFIRNRLIWDIQDRLGHPSPHGRFVHVFHNGLYQGQYHFAERPDGKFFENYYGDADKDTYEIRKSGSFVQQPVSPTFFSQMEGYINSNNLNLQAGWDGLSNYIDIDQTANFLAMNHFGGNFDWGYSHNNWGGAFPATGQGGYKMIMWDFDLTMGNPGRFGDTYNDPAYNATGNVGPVPNGLYNSTEFKVKLGDSIHCTCFDDGVFSPTTFAAMWNYRANQVRLPLVAEAARWGNVTFTGAGNINAQWDPEDEWLAEWNRMLNDWIPFRADNLVQQYKNRAQYPQVDGVVFSQNGGAVANGFQLTLTGPGTIYYTLDGSDPRDFGGTISASALIYNGPITLPSNVVEVRARTRVGGLWSAMCPKRFYPTQPYSDVLISEIQYHGSDICGSTDTNEMDFLELHNRGLVPVDLSDVEVTEGVRYKFPFGSILAPGGYLVLAENASLFQALYGFAPFAQFSGNLSNGGETLLLLDPFGVPFDEVTYNDKGGWDEGADGLGPSLELLDASLDNSLAPHWLASPAPCGTPGAANSYQCSPAPAAIVINEISYKPTDAPGMIGEREWLELHNPGAAAVSLAGWTLSTESTSIVFAAGTSIPADGYMVLADGAAPFANLAAGAMVQFVPDLSFDNGGERILLLSDQDCFVDIVAYDDKPDWPLLADGGGPSLALIDPAFDNADPLSWSDSGRIGGTPGSANVLPNCVTLSVNVVINEIHYQSGGGADPGDWVEIHNAGSNPANLSNWELQDSGTTWTLPGNVFLAPGGYLTVARDLAAFQAVYPGAGAVLGGFGFDLGTSESLALYSEGRCQLMDEVPYQSVAPWPTAPNGQGPSLSLLDAQSDNSRAFNWQPNAATPGEPNAIPDPCLAAVPEIVINEIRVSGAANAISGDWLELHNPGAAAVSLAGWALFDNSGSFVLPNGAILPGGGYLIVAQNLFAFQAAYPGVPAVGSTSFGFSGSGESLWLVSNGGCIVDQVSYGDMSPWPNNSDVLALVDPASDNALGANWAEANDQETPGAANVFRVAPGGVDNDLFLWFVADDGLTPSGWLDRSGKTNDATIVSAGQTPAVSANAINQHDTLLFAGSQTLQLVDLPRGNKTFFAVQQASEHESYLRWQSSSDSLRLEDGGKLRHGLNPTTISTSLANGPDWQLPSAVIETESLLGVKTYHDGNLQAATTWSVPVAAVTDGYIGSRAGVAEFFTGQIAEIIGLDQAASPQEIQHILSYLSVKYGLTIPVAEHLYFDQTSHPERLAGLGTDLRSLLAQSSGQSAKLDSILRMHSPTDLDHGEYLTWGSDAGGLGIGGFAVPSFLDAPLERTWRVTRVGDLGTVSVSFDLAGLGLDLSDAAQFNLLIDMDDGDFSNATMHQTGRAFVGDVLTFTGANIPDGAWLSLATEQNIIPVTLAGPGDLTRPEMQPITFSITDPTGNGGMVFSLVNGPAGASLSPGGAFTWTPSEAQGPGSFAVEVLGEDANGGVIRQGTYTMTITVTEVNRPGVFTADGPFAIDEMSPWQFAVAATDPDLPVNSLSFSLGVDTPLGMSVNPATGEVSWTPNEGQGPASVDFHIVATDNGSPALVSSQEYTVVVNEVNRAPAISSLPQQTVDEQTLLSLNLNAVDPDNPLNALTWNLVNGPAGVTLSPAGALTWTPTEAQGPATYSIDVRVVDNGTPPLADTATISVEVLEANRSPVIAAIPLQQALEQQAFALTIPGSDPDLPANGLTYSLVVGPSGASLSPTGSFTWTPGETDGGSTVPVTVRVTDNGTPALSADRSFQIAVAEVNEAPSITAVAPVTIPEMSPWSMPLAATDSDLPANTFTWALLAGPAGVSVSPLGEIAWTPTEAQGPASYTVSVQVTDNGSPAATDTLDITVNVSEINRQPSIVAIAPQNATEHQLFQVQLSGSDPDLPANGLAYSLVNAPTGASISPAGLFSWTPGEADGGIPVQIRARLTDDGNPARFVDTVFNVAVAEVNAAPVLSAVADQTLGEGQVWVQPLVVSDSDLPTQTLTFSLLSGPSGMSLDLMTGQLDWTPDESHGPGTYTVQVEVVDNGVPVLSDSSSFILTVIDTNSDPVFSPQADVTIDEHELLVLPLNAVDLDSPAQVVTYSLGAGAPTGMRIDPISGTVTWLPDEGTGGSSLPLSVIASDDQTPPGSSTLQLTLNIAEHNTTPILYAGTPCQALTTFVPRTGMWRYHALGGLPASSWAEPWYDDSTWLSGSGEFGFGDGGEATVLPAGNMTYYFRTTFTATDVGALSALHIELLRDDGLIVYLNGREVLRDNMPAGPITDLTQASSSIFGLGERTYYPFAIDPGLLAEGVNTLAVEVHQRAINSNDLSFDLSISATRPEDCGTSLFTMAGQAVSQQITVFDPDTPTQTHTFGMLPMSGSQLSAGGLLTFTPTAAQAGSQLVTVQATDTGSPAATGSVALDIVVHPMLEINEDAMHESSEIEWPSIAGSTYVVEYCDDLLTGAWTVLTTATASGTVVSVTDPAMATADPMMHRCYRIRFNY